MEEQYIVRVPGGSSRFYALDQVDELLTYVEFLVTHPSQKGSLEISRFEIRPTQRKFADEGPCTTN